MNPLGKVPILVDPALGHPLFESGAILIYLAERYGRFLPANGFARYEVMQWLMVQMATVGPMLGQLNHFRLVLRPGSEPYAAGRFAAQSERIYRLLDDRLGVLQIGRASCRERVEVSGGAGPGKKKTKEQRRQKKEI